MLLIESILFMFSFFFPREIFDSLNICKICEVNHDKLTNRKLFWDQLLRIWSSKEICATNFSVRIYKFDSIFWYKYKGKEKSYLVLFCAVIVVPGKNQKEKMEIVAETWIKNTTYLLKFTRLDQRRFNRCCWKPNWKSLGGLESCQSVLNLQESVAFFPKWKKITFNYCMPKLNIEFYCSTRVDELRCATVYVPILAA